MLECEITILANNIVVPFQNFHKKFNLGFIKSNKFIMTKCLAEHGLGFLINIYKTNKQSNGRKLIKKLIFDTGGPNLTFLFNLHLMDFSINNIDGIMLSHWHYDHIGGLHRILLQNQNEIPIYCHESAKFERFFVRSDEIQNSDLEGKTRKELKTLLEQTKIVAQKPINIEEISDFNGKVNFLNKDCTIFDLDEIKIILSGEIPRNHEDEDFSSFFAIKKQNRLERDEILDDKCLIIEFKENIIVLCGCCHSGLKNTIDYVKSRTKKPITHIIGGFHLASATDYKINNTLEYLETFQKELNELFLFPMHCTGESFNYNYVLKAKNSKEKMKSKLFMASVGTQFIFKC